MIKTKSAIWLLFILSPFLSVLQAFAHPKNKWAKNVVWLFFMFYGFTFVIPRETMDAASYRNKLVEAHQSEWTFSDFTHTLYNPEIRQGETDLLEPLLKWAVSTFTSDYRVLFLFFALVYGYFYSRIIWFVLDEFGYQKSAFYVLLITCFAIVSPIWYISGFRWYTALTFNFYFLLLYWKHDKLKYLIYGLGAIFIHYSFTLLIPIYLIFIFVRTRVNLLFILFLASQFVSQVDVQLVSGLMPRSILPEVFITESEGYLSESRVEALSSVRADKVWYAKIYGDWFKWSLIFCVSLIFIRKRDQIMQNDWLLKIFSATFYTFFIATLLQNLPSMGRFHSLAFYCGFLAVISYLSIYSGAIKLKRILALFASPGLILYAAIVVKNGLETFSILTFLGNPIIALITNIDISFIDFIEP